MKKIILSLVCFAWLMTLLAQSAGFEGILEYTLLHGHDPEYLQKTISGFKNLGWSERNIKPFQVDSSRFRIYIKQDSVWTELYLNDEAHFYKIDYQAGFHFETIDPDEGDRIVFSNEKALEKIMDESLDDPNWRDKIKVSDWFKTDYSKLKKLPRRKEIINGLSCQVYELLSSVPNSPPTYYWITEDFVGAETQQIPYAFNNIFTPKGTIVKNEWHKPNVQHSQRILRKVIPGPIAPILPRLRSIDFGTLDSVQYVDKVFNQHLAGKSIEQTPTVPDFSFYRVGSNQLDHLYSRQEQGKFILIDLWGTWCGPCLREMPQLQAFQAEHAAVLEVIGLNLGDHRANYVQEVMRKHNMSGTQGYAGKLLKAYLNPGKSVPHAILLDANMKVRWRGNPAGNWDKLAELVRGR